MTLPSYSAAEEPKVEAIRVADTELQLVNWLDYTGWEVRVAAVPGQDARLLGRIHAQMHGAPDQVTGWVAELAPRPGERTESRTFLVRDNPTARRRALSFLVTGN